MKIQVLPAILPRPLVCIKMQLPLQAQQRTNNFGYKNRPAEFKGAGHICKCLQDWVPSCCMEFRLAFCSPVGSVILFSNTTSISAF